MGDNDDDYDTGPGRAELIAMWVLICAGVVLGGIALGAVLDWLPWL